MILAGDIGGTKCNLALFEAHFGALERVAQKRFVSRNYASMEDILREFLAGAGAGAGPSRKIAAAGFGLPGPVVGNQVRATNLPWIVDGAAVAAALGGTRVVLLNDLEAAAHSLEILKPAEICVLNEGIPEPCANRALIAAGTGLGEALLIWDGSRHVITATEGGHADFAARNAREIELLRHVQRQHKRVDAEEIISGRGFRTIHEFLDASVRHPSFDDPHADPAPEITRLGLAGECPVCVEALDMWTAAYGAEAGNLALRSLARGGVYVAGGIAVKILKKMQDGTFVRAFCEKEKFGIFLKQIPIYLVLNEDAPLLGAAARATAALGS